jgi:uncharacterized oxidoreductase
MKTFGNCILITGGASGIGLELARLFTSLGNEVIICGRNREKLELAKDLLPEITAIQCDITNHNEVTNLLNVLNSMGKQINILINNAAKANTYKLGKVENAYAKAAEEMSTNYLSGIYLIDRLLPEMLEQGSAAIVNISSILALTPAALAPTYSASKAALHSFTQILRLSLRESKVRVFEILPPVVDTDFSKDLPAKVRMPAADVANEIISAIENDIFEMHLGATKSIYKLMQHDAEKALLVVNGLATI